MADIPNRFDLEAQLAAALARVQSEQRRELEPLLGDPPDPSRVSAVVWQKHQDETAAAIVILLLAAFEESAARMFTAAGVEFDPGRLRAAAEQWAAAYASRLSAQIIANTMTGVGGTAGLVAVLGPARAEGIAITEITKAATTAERAAAGVLVAGGMTAKIVAVWKTSEDAAVCKICSPLNDQPEDVWSLQVPSGPPAHPRCRCWLDWVDA